MKKITLLALLTLSIISCNNLKDNEFLISGEAKGIENGKKAFVEMQSELGTIIMDTAVVTDGKFELRGIAKNIDLGFVRIENSPINLPIIIEEGKIDIKIVKDSLHKSSLGGTPNNDMFQKFNNESRAISEKVAKYERDNGEIMQNAQVKKDTVTIKRLMSEYQKFQDEMNVYSKKFINDNPDTYISVLLLENFLMRNYLSKEEVTKIYNKLDKTMQQTNSGKRISAVIFKKNVVKIGEKAPNFSANSPEGKRISLKETLGKVTIIDFWASWCGPCRGENPNVVALYNEFHAQGLNIIGVSLDKDAAKWKEAIAKDGLTWPQISNLKYWNEPIAKMYNVESIPATFILDAKGNIVAKDLRGDELRAKVKELLGVK
ncbi:TlpA disulfide reductase family protein [Flavobacterium proteolyticum]|uniref:AhpC/TSA family protein n=1 Tax=Flavobacterium proteolyticum TaxID=2911683 RepID=A0ABR9WUE1_9FLAO|nr:TlpA disulfide reductase family protein [Flavobacterium proteolyticum]MBE9577254.1 AhpC/TSA family protein [Flavobacterium proteolyticum]